MKGVPWWFLTLARLLAIGFSVWTGLHFHAAHGSEWILIYGVTAALSAALPHHRELGFIGLLLGLGVGVWGAYLLRDVWSALAIRDVIAIDGGPLTSAREAAMTVVAAAWLVIGSAFRTRRA